MEQARYVVTCKTVGDVKNFLLPWPEKNPNNTLLTSNFTNSGFED